MVAQLISIVPLCRVSHLLKVLDALCQSRKIKDKVKRLEGKLFPRTFPNAEFRRDESKFVNPGVEESRQKRKTDAVQREQQFEMRNSLAPFIRKKIRRQEVKYAYF